MPLQLALWQGKAELSIVLSAIAAAKMPHSENSSGPAPPILHIALFQPDIAQNTGTIIRMAACFGLPVSIIEPAGFPVSDRAFRRAGMDYLDAATIHRHVNFSQFDLWRGAGGHRLILATTRASLPHTAFAYRPGDILLLGRESLGAPDEVHAAADARIRIPMRPTLRSLNIAMSAAILTGEALRQLDAFPKETA